MQFNKWSIISDTFVTLKICHLGFAIAFVLFDRMEFVNIDETLNCGFPFTSVSVELNWVNPS